ncbi:MAG: alpha/beta hydrolase [Candidatus Helarchaeota archaeon]
MPSKEIEQIKTLLKSSKMFEKDQEGIEATLEKRRKSLERIAKMLRIKKDIKCETFKIKDIPAEWVIAPNASDERVVLYLHGGGYILGSIDTHRELASRISRASGARVLLIGYRLAPEHKFPAAIEDATLTYRWLLKEGFKSENIVIAGDSAGGNLTIVTLLALKEQGEPLPAAAVCLSPWTDMEGLGESVIKKAEEDPWLSANSTSEIARLYLGDVDPRDPLATPLYADLSGLPPILIQVGTSEILLDDSVRLEERAKKAGVEVILDIWEGMIHVFQAFAAYLPEGREAISKIGDFIRNKTRID